MLLEKWKMNKQQILILLCVGILLVIIAVPANPVENTDTEGKLEAILMKIAGIGNVHVMITMDEDKVHGIVISAQGGDDPAIAKEIVEVVQALFDIEVHKIKVIKGG